MAETIALIEFVVIVALIGVVWLLNDELRRKRDERIEQSLRPEKNFALVSPMHGQPTRVMTAKDIVAGNLQRQVTRRTKSWADIRARVEQGLEEDSETKRSKRVEQYLGETNA